MLTREIRIQKQFFFYNSLVYTVKQFFIRTISRNSFRIQIGFHCLIALDIRTCFFCRFDNLTILRKWNRILDQPMQYPLQMPDSHKSIANAQQEQQNDYYQQTNNSLHTRKRIL